jgi:hypothetical protein
VQPAIAAHTRVCSYDCAGIGYRDAGRRPADSANIVDDLHSLLNVASIKPHYVLVGHSMGGMHARIKQARVAASRRVFARPVRPLLGREATLVFFAKQPPNADHRDTAFCISRSKFAGTQIDNATAERKLCLE